MCGIAGLIDIVEGQSIPRLLGCMRDVMISRGPDGEGCYVDGVIGMAMRRLSIIDLERGGQPFFSADRNAVAFQNGEIYNYRDLRDQLEARGCRFVSQSDTEVLAHGFAEWGIEGLLDRLDGMYAIAIYDRRSHALHLARDRFGEKPLFYTHARGRFAYASNLLAIMALDWVSDELKGESLDRYLALHYVSGDSTIFNSVRRVLPGERIVVRTDDPYPLRHRYYRMRLDGKADHSEQDLAQILEESVSSRLVADVPVGVFLSGGLDSSIIAAIAARKQPNIATFSMGFTSSSHDESPYAELMAKEIGSTHHHFVFQEDSFRSLLPQVAAALDEPIGDQAMLPLYWLCREASRHVKVALSGEGADEVFAGYSYYGRHVRIEKNWGEKFRQRLGGTTDDQFQFQRLIYNAENLTPSGFPLLTDIAGRERLTGVKTDGADEWEAELISWLNRTDDGLRRAAATDLSTWLPDDLLVKFDRMSMAHSLEGRAPYLNAKIVELGLLLPQKRKINRERNKIALREIAPQWLPGEIANRPKQGFVLPMAKWLSQWLITHGSVRDYFRDRAVPGLDISEAARVTEEDLSVGVQRERLLFALVMLIEWYQAFRIRQFELTKTYRAAKTASVEVQPVSG